MEGAGGQNVSKIKKFLSSSLFRVEFLLRVSERPLISLARAVVSNYFLLVAATNQYNNVLFDQRETINELTLQQDYVGVTLSVCLAPVLNLYTARQRDSKILGLNGESSFD